MAELTRLDGGPAEVVGLEQTAETVTEKVAHPRPIRKEQRVAGTVKTRPLRATWRGRLEKGKHDAMAHRPIDVYLNDHLAGATFGADLARQLEARTEGTDFQPEMSRLAAEIEADLKTLTDLMERIGATRNPLKQITAWIADKASRPKLTGATSGDDELGTFLSIEALSLGVAGKASLWTTLRELRGDYPELLSTDLDDLLQRARRQRQVLETERRAAARRSLTTDVEA